MTPPSLLLCISNLRDLSIIRINILYSERGGSILRKITESHQIYIKFKDDLVTLELLYCEQITVVLLQFALKTGFSQYCGKSAYMIPSSTTKGLQIYLFTKFTAVHASVYCVLYAHQTSDFFGTVKIRNKNGRSTTQIFVERIFPHRSNQRLLCGRRTCVR